MIMKVSNPQKRKTTHISASLHLVTEKGVWTTLGRECDTFRF